MKPPYEECTKCVATGFCKKYSGAVEVPKTTSWCSAKFRLDKALGLADLPKIYRGANIYNYILDKDNKPVHDIISPYVENIVTEVVDGVNFFFYNAKPGTGKTFHGALLINHYIYKTCLTEEFDFENPLGLFVVYADLMHDLRYHRDDEEVLKKLEQIKKVPILLLDDIGSGSNSDFTREQTYIILNQRFNEGLSTIITSNLDVAGLSAPTVLGSRNVSRIVSRCQGVDIGGADRRMKTVRKGRS